MADIGFIGLGNMGAHMARNLIKAGHSLKVFDLNGCTTSCSPSGARVLGSVAPRISDQFLTSPA